MVERKPARRTSVKDIRSILRLTYEQALSVREISDRLKMSKTSIATYIYRAREIGLTSWPLPDGYEDDIAIAKHLLGRAGRPPQDLSVPDWAQVARELKRKNVTLALLWQEYRAAHPDGYGYSWFCDSYSAFERKLIPNLID